MLPENYGLQMIHWHIVTWPDLCFIVEEISSKTKIAGYILCRTEDDNNKIGLISSIAVLPEFQGNGLAKKLIREAEKNSKGLYGIEKIKLQVRISNLNAIELYKKCGYFFSHNIEKYYADDEDCQIFEKNLI